MTDYIAGRLRAFRNFFNWPVVFAELVAAGSLAVAAAMAFVVVFNTAVAAGDRVIAAMATFLEANPSTALAVPATVAALGAAAALLALITVRP